MNSEALFILTALDIWDWNILKFNLKISSPLLKQKHYTLDVLAQKKEKYFFISLFQPGKKHFFSQHNWPLKEIFSDLNEHFLDLLVQKIFLNFPPECPIKYFVLVQNDEGVTRKELPDFILQHESKIFQKLKGDLS